MQVKKSEYIAKKRPEYEALLERMRAEFPVSSLLVQDSNSKIWRRSATGASVRGASTYNKRGCVARIHDGRGFGEYSFTDSGLDAVMDKLRAMLPLTGGDPVPQPAEPITFHKATEYKIDPLELGDEAILAKLEEIREAALKYDERILDCSVRADYQIIHKLFLAPGRDMEQDIMWFTGGVNVMAARGEEIKEYYRGFSALGGAEVLDGMLEAVPEVAKCTLEMLESQPITPGEYDCVCAPDVSGMIAHEAFGHGVEMDMFVKKRAQAENFIGKYVASPIVTMHDGASAALQTGTYFFDDEGTLATDTVIIKDGVLLRGLSDALSAERLDTEPTGNGRRESFERKAYTRMTNTYFEGGTDTLDDMIKSIKFGYLLENAFSGMEDPKNWGIQLMVNVAREIVDGRLTGRLYSPIVLTGYVPDLLKSISMLALNPHLEGGGMCGKGYKEWVKVSDGGPYFKARMRLG